MENQGPMLRPLKEKLRDHWNTRDEILKPKPERANMLGMCFSWAYSTTLTVTLSYIILPELDLYGIWHQLASWAIWVIVMWNWILATRGSQATRENVPQDHASDASRLPHGWKNCPLCQLDVPPRSHHCKICGICVLKRDHHCFFTGTCIGWENQRRFIVFLFYTSFGTLHGICLMSLYLSESNAEWSYYWYNYLPVVSIVGWLSGNISSGHFWLLMELYVCCVVFFAAIGFYTWQLAMVFRGQTSYEAAHNMSKYRCSIMDGMRSTFGSYGLIHFLIPLPFAQHGNGIDWPIYKYYKSH